ncbi:MAG: saccharopine dehydrogenase NADP-binding domain-containing protein [Microcella sp.]|uniref:saccharopine dehydrogenase NADP-binding domain-containing protein n=1 Tax=Microcella sp. TaxID=1913979 RepID=UPI0024C98355|nr:saccharopine dehydrogenase NADP-binding domain-containing protein [Microcella sp.]UYN84454.1 MAG: saccharopine dehydrogenase NADP-binding domain-containing protein [Microcella sp.]
MSRKDQVLVYGAAGHTGRFIVDELVSRGVSPVLAGRDPVRLESLAARHPALEQRAFSLDSPLTLRAALTGSSVVINAAGPFADTAIELADAAIAAGAHYLDISAEQDSVRRVFHECDAAAKAAGVAVVPAMAFFGGLPDLLASSILGQDRGISDVTVAMWIDRWWPTAGTRATGRRNAGRRWVFTDGELAPFGGDDRGQTWVFAPNVGRQVVVEMPFSEVLTIAQHLPVRSVRSFISSRALDDVRDDATPPPEASDGRGRSRQRFVVEVEALIDGTRRRIGATGRDIYASTAPIVVEGALRLLRGEALAIGAVAPGEAFDARSMLSALGRANLTIFEPVERSTAHDLSVGTQPS